MAELSKVLRSPDLLAALERGLRRSLVEREDSFSDLVPECKAEYRDFLYDDIRACRHHPSENCSCREFFAQHASKHFGESLRSLILSRLVRPRNCTYDDLLDAVVNNLNVTSDQLHSAHLRFCAAVEAVSGVERSGGSIEVAQSEIEFAESRDSMTNFDRPLHLWNSENGFHIQLVGRPAHAQGVAYEEYDYPSTTLSALVWCRGTERAIREFQKEIRPLLRSLLQTFRLIAMGPPPQFKTIELSTLGFGSGPSRPFPMSPSIAIFDSESRSFVLRDPFTWIADCLNAYFENPTKKASMERRIRNAVHLLVEADRQEHEALSLALSVSALEAMLGEGHADISKNLAEYIATLFEPDPRYRLAAVKCVKQIYDDRSRVLHGEQLDNDTQRVHDARFLASGVLLGVLQWGQFMRKIGKDLDRPDQLLSELRNSKFVPGEIVGVDVSPVRKLWRTNA